MLQIQSPVVNGLFLNLNLFAFSHSCKACEKGIYELPSGLFTKYLHFDFCLLCSVFSL